MMSSAYIQVHFRQDLIMEANTMNPDQTAPGSLIWVHIVCHKDYLRTLADEIADDKSRDLQE